jgi:hypothetical protein
MSVPPPKTPPKPVDVPEPNSVPKLSQAIFILENRLRGDDTATPRPSGK